jgi:hypothetical protein
VSLSTTDQLRSEYFEPRGLYAPESHWKRNLSNIARVIRALKGLYPDPMKARRTEPATISVPSPPAPWRDLMEARTVSSLATAAHREPSASHRCSSSGIPSSQEAKPRQNRSSTLQPRLATPTRSSEPTLQSTRWPIQNVDDARLRGRGKLRVVNKTGEGSPAKQRNQTGAKLILLVGAQGLEPWTR